MLLAVAAAEHRANLLDKAITHIVAHHTVDITHIIYVHKQKGHPFSLEGVKIPPQFGTVGKPGQLVIVRQTVQEPILLHLTGNIRMAACHTDDGAITGAIRNSMALHPAVRTVPAAEPVSVLVHIASAFQEIHEGVYCLGRIIRME